MQHPRLSLLTVVLLSTTASLVQAGWSVGVRFTLPGPPAPCVRPAWVYAPAPVYVTPVPVVLQPLPPPQSAPLPLQPSDTRQQDVARYLARLQHPDVRQRLEAVQQLGRLQALTALQTLCQVLQQDSSEIIRESAAWSLGRIASPDALPALQRAAQMDSDRVVRQSASRSADLIRAQLSRR